eukprot:m.454937 g.454937  ORF g.454937 m.454937 type:complete len:587 (+) comp21570_c0_seq42:371-2131(+)
MTRHAPRSANNKMLQAIFVAAACKIIAAQSTSGCRDGSREGFTNTTAYPKIAACRGTTTGVDVRSTAASVAFCATGWHVCTGREINAGRSDPAHFTSITYDMAGSFTGKYAYNANNDCNSCQDTCGSRTGRGHSQVGCTVSGGTDPDLACMGSGCSRTRTPACIADGRYNSGNRGCVIASGSNMDGMICCRDDYINATEDGQLEQVFAVDFQMTAAPQTTQYGYVPAVIPADNGAMITVTQNGISASVSGYSHRRAYGNPAQYSPLVRDEVLLNRAGTIQVEINHVPPGAYNMVMFHNDANQNHCGGCFQAEVNTGVGAAQTQYFRTSNQRTIGTVTQTAWNITVGSDQRITVNLRQQGTQFQTGYCTATCAEVNVGSGSCRRCTRADAHLSLNGIILRGPPLVTTTTTTTTMTTHTVQQDVNRSINSILSTQDAHSGDIATLQRELSASVSAAASTQLSTQVFLDNLALVSDNNTETLNGGGASGYTGVIPMMLSMQTALSSVTSELSSMKQALGAVASFAVGPGATPDGTINPPAVSGDGGNVNINAPNGNIMVNGQTCSSVDLCTAMSAIENIATSIRAATSP